MTDDLRGSSRGELLQVLWEQAGLDVAELTPTSVGESRSAYWITDRAGTVSVLKIIRQAGPQLTQQLPVLQVVVSRLRDRGYPAARLRAIAQVPGLAFWVQERLPGNTLELGRGQPDGSTLARLLPQVLNLNDAQAGLRLGKRGWPDLIAQTLTHGGDGYCLHDTLRTRPDTRDLLRELREIADRCCAAVPAGDDFVHFDFTPANLLSDGESITGVIDINPPVLAGDRAFDLATMLFYLYDHDDIRNALTARLFELAHPHAVHAYLAHMVLRQVDWSLRHYPGAALTRHHLRLAALVIRDIRPSHGGEHQASGGCFH